MSEDSAAFQSELKNAREKFAGFLEAIPKTTRVTGMHDSDADGVTAGVLWQIGMQRLEYSQLQRIAPDRRRNAWTSENSALAAATKPDAFFLMDLGSQKTRVVPGAPHCIIDHHKPEGAPPEDVLISAYNWNPIPNTSWLVWQLLRPLANVEDLDWIAAIGIISDLGEKAPFEFLAIAKKKYTAKYLKEVSALLNATHRSSSYNPTAAAQALLGAQNPKELVLSNAPAVAELKAAREEVKAAMNEAKKVAPVFSKSQPVALIRISSACRVHPLIAQIWRTRLPNYIVIAANDAYLENRVNFSARAGKQFNVLQFLNSFEIADGEGDFGHGHDQASGGSLSFARWNELLRAMEFEPDVLTDKK